MSWAIKHTVKCKIKEAYIKVATITNKENVSTPNQPWRREESLMFWFTCFQKKNCYKFTDLLGNFEEKILEAANIKVFNDRKTTNVLHEEILHDYPKSDQIFTTSNPVNFESACEYDNEKDKNSFKKNSVKKISQENLESIKNSYMLPNNVINLLQKHL